MSTRIGRTRGSRRARARRRLLVRRVVAVLVVLLLVDVVWAGWAAYDGLRDARDSIAIGSSALREGDLALATASLSTAEAAAGRAATLGSHPSAVLAGALPWIGDDVHAVDAVATAAELAASAGSSLAAALVATGWTGEGIPGVEAGGRMDPTVIEAAQPSLQAASSKLDAAVASMDDIDVDALVSPLARAVTQVDAELDEQASVVGAARDLSVLLPPMLGGEQPRTYLLALQNLSAPRGTGGFLGFYGSLTATNGTVELDELTAASTVPEVRPVDVPADAARLYSRFGVRTTFWAANYSPDVPTSSTIALEIAEEAGLGSFDGVIWTDTVWLASMLGAVGPVDSTGWAEPLTADNLVDVLNRQTFLETSAMRSDDLQARIGLDVWDALLTRPADAVELASIMADATASGHFTAFSTTSNEESLLADLGADGAFEPGTNPFTVIWQDAGATRAAFFAEKRASTEIALGADGTAQVATTVTLNNGAPDGPPSILLGTGGGSPPIGWMGLDVEVYLPEGASEPQIETSEASVYSVQRAFDRRVGGCFLYGDPGDEMTCTLSYAAPDAATPVDDGWEYRMQIQPQPSLAPMPVSVTVQIPDGSEIEEMPPGASVDGTTVTWTGAPAEPTTLVFRYA